jgi:hypothetical protein
MSYLSMKKITTHTVVPADIFATDDDPSQQPTPSHTTKNRVGYVLNLILDLLDHRAMTFPQSWIFVRWDEYPIEAVG